MTITTAEEKTDKNPCHTKWTRGLGIDAYCARNRKIDFCKDVSESK